MIQPLPKLCNFKVWFGIRKTILTPAKEVKNLGHKVPWSFETLIKYWILVFDTRKANLTLDKQSSNANFHSLQLPWRYRMPAYSGWPFGYRSRLKTKGRVTQREQPYETDLGHKIGAVHVYHINPVGPTFVEAANHCAKSNILQERQWLIRYSLSRSCLTRRFLDPICRPPKYITKLV